MATRLTHWAMRRMPSDSVQLGSLLHGLGEIDAHAGDAHIAQRLTEHLRRRCYSRRRIIAIFDAVAQCETEIKKPISLDILAFAQWISGSQIGWDAFRDAVTSVERAHAPPIHGHFGLKFVARIILSFDPHAIDAWIAKRAGQPVVAIIGSAVVNAVAFADTQTHVVRLLGSRTPAIQCLAAASLILPNPFRPVAADYRDGHRMLVEGGIAPGVATWMMGLRIKDTIHQRYGLEHRREQWEARLRYLEQNPDAAMGGGDNLDAELGSLHAQLDDVSRRYAKLLPELEQMLSDMAAVWPAQGLSPDQMDALENISGDQTSPRPKARAPGQPRSAPDKKHRPGSGLHRTENFRATRHGLFLSRREAVCDHRTLGRAIGGSALFSGSSWYRAANKRSCQAAYRSLSCRFAAALYCCPAANPMAIHSDPLGLRRYIRVDGRRLRAGGASRRGRHSKWACARAYF
jgi:hypothetical protein